MTSNRQELRRVYQNSHYALERMPMHRFISTHPMPAINQLNEAHNDILDFITEMLTMIGSLQERIAELEDRTLIYK